ncbi:MAG: phosphoesterase [Solirubrobacterales bacterium]|nr:phosphoesterase [Solirubrobacterales bacterium]
MSRTTMITRALATSIAALALAAGAAPAGAALPPVKHVWVVVLENTNYAEAFGTAKAPYLSQTLASQGQLLRQYYGIAHNSQPNYIAMISGQAANVQTQADCQIYTEMLPGVVGPDGQAIGQGCVYPAGVPTLADQLTAKGLTWKGYLQDMGTPCRHPSINTQDTTQSAKVGDQYAARHNPFVYFHSITDSAACVANVRDLNELQADLTTSATSPSFSLVVPNLCEDGHDEPCVDGRPGGVVSADAFLQTWIPKITTSAAYADGGLVVVTFDEAESSDATACCQEPAGFNTPNPGALTFGPGGGRTGTVLLSPYITPGTVNDTPYNHYSLLRSVEDLFGLAHLGYAGQAGLAAFGSDVFG